MATHRLLFGLLLAAVCSTASADLTLDALGDPEEGGSWFQSFRLAAPVTFKGLGVVLTYNDAPPEAALADRLYHGLEQTDAFSAMSFAVPGGTDGWAQELVTPGPVFGHTVQSSGVFTNELVWRMHFRDLPSTQSFTITLFAYDEPYEPLPLGDAAATWTGSEWDFNVERGVTWQEYLQVVQTTTGHAPAPSAAWLALIGLGTVGLRRTRK